MKPFLYFLVSKVALKNEDNAIFGNQELTKMLNDFFEDAVED